MQTSVTRRALIARINRKLRPRGEKLRTARSQGVELDLGRYFVVDVQDNSVMYPHADPEVWGRDLGVIAPSESVAAD